MKYSQFLCGDDGNDDRWHEVLPHGETEFYRPFVPVEFTERHCKKCDAFLGWIDESVFRRLGGVCDSCFNSQPK